ncbi:MAG: hypothetical protein ACE5DZ_08460 [Mariprofundus sp.]
MKMKPIFHLDMSGYKKDEPKAMLEMVGAQLFSNLTDRYPENEGYAVHRVIRARSSPFAAKWDIYLTRGHFWKFQISLEVSQSNNKRMFHISMGRNLDWNAMYLMVGMVISLISLTIALVNPAEPFNTNIILPILIGTFIGSFALCLPIRWIIRPYILMQAKHNGIEQCEARIIEEINTVMQRAGHIPNRLSSDPKVAN